MGRAPCCEKVGLKKGRWTAEEDEILLKYIEANGEGSWRSLPKNAGLLRCGKSCRLRWINYLRTDLKRGNISAEEEDTIMKLHASLGNKWSLIASQFPGRTDNEIKNYWNSHLSRKIYPFRRPAAIQNLPIIMNLAKTSTGSKRKGSKTNTRPSMKKTKSTTHTDSATAPQENVTLPSDHISWKEKKNESMLLDSCAADQQGEERIILNLVNVPGPNQDTRAEERESTQGTLSHCDEERESNNNSNSMLCCPIDERQTAMLGPYNEGEIFDDSGVLSFNDINMDNIELLDPNGFLSLSCEQQKRDQDDLIFMDYSSSKMATSEDIESGNLSSNGESSGTHHELLSCSSTSYFDHDHHGRVVWEWEDVVNGHDNQMVDKQEDGQMLSWLWESNDWERECQEFGGEMDKYCEKQKAMVDWLLS